MRALSLVLGLLLAPAAWSAPLDEAVGRTEVRIRSEAFPLLPGGTVTGYALPERLERLGYVRVHERPSAPGQYFWGTDVFWVYRRAHRVEGRDYPDLLLGLVLDGDGRVLEGRFDDGRPMPLTGKNGRWLEPEVLAESPDETRAPRVRVTLSTLPEHAWRPVLALEDTRFFDHIGVDGIAIARAAFENLTAGEVTQGGSTITQQLVKNRDLTPKQTLDRKASEAVRALALEAEYTKEEILEAYLNTVYYGHVDGVAIHGLGTAARVFFDEDASELTLAEAALLAAVLQGPNGLSPIRHPDAAKKRRDRALERMEELGWASPEEVARARATPIALRLTTPQRPLAPWFRDLVVSDVREAKAARLDKGLGFAADTTLDPWLQARAEAAVAAHLASLRRARPGIHGLSAALVSLDAETGAVLAYVGGDPAAPDGLDRARALRQPGSTVKPLVLLEAFERCGARRPLSAATRVSDDPLTLNVPEGTWTPENYDHTQHGDVSIREALMQSYNLPFVRIARYCGFDETAARLRDAGLALPEPAPPSFALGAVETTPLQLAGAFLVVGNLGKAGTPLAVTRVEKPGGGLLDRERAHTPRVVSKGTAWLVRDLMRDVVTDGTGKAAAVPGLDVAGKTGTTPADAWFVGHAGGLVTAVWIGRDDGERLGLGGGSTAAPLFAAFMADAVAARPPHEAERPAAIVERWVNPESGRLIASPLHDGEEEVFRRGAVPKRDPLLGDRPDAVIH